MTKTHRVRFSVYLQNEAEALARFAADGFLHSSVETEEDGVRVLVFTKLSDDALGKWVLAAPRHLSANQGVVVGNQPPFST